MERQTQSRGTCFWRVRNVKQWRRTTPPPFVRIVGPFMSKQKAIQLCCFCGREANPAAEPEKQPPPPSLVGTFTDEKTGEVFRTRHLCIGCCLFVYGNVKKKVDAGQFRFEPEPVPDRKVDAAAPPGISFVPGGKIVKPN